MIQGASEAVNQGLLVRNRVEELDVVETHERAARPRPGIGYSA